MDIQEQAQDDNQQELNSKNYVSSGDVKKFNIELTVSQANALDKILPRGYSLQVEREIKNKRNNLKKNTNASKKEPVNNQMEVEEPSERITKTKSAQRYTQDLNSLNNYSRAASSNYYQ